MTQISEEKRAKRNAYMREWKKENREYVNALKREYQKNNSEKFLAWSREYRKRHPETGRRAVKKWAKANPEKVKALFNKFHEENPNYNKDYLAKRKEEMPMLMILNGIRTRCKNKKLSFNITLEDLLPMPNICPVLGIPIKVRKMENGNRGGFQGNSPSVDRIIPELGYVKGNIRVISYRANALKSDATPDELYKVWQYAKEETERVKNTIL